MKVSIQIFITISGYILYALYYYLVAPQSSYAELGIQSIIVLALTFFFLVGVNRYRIFSYPVIFSLLVWLFHFGNFPPYVFGAEKAITVNDFRHYTFESPHAAFNVCILFYIVLNIGLIVKKPKEIVKISEKNKIYFNKNFIRIVKVFFAICLVPYMIYTIRMFTLSGYSAIRKQNMAGALSYIALVLYSCAIILFCDAVMKHKIWMILFLYVCFAIQIFVGQRLDSVCLEVTFLIIHLDHRKINVKSIILLGIFVFFGIYILDVVARYRHDLSLLFSKMFALSTVQSFFQNNPIFIFMGNFGGTVTTVIGAVRNFTLDNYLFGITYVAALARIFPAIHRFLPSIWETYIYAFDESDMHSLGGSIIGEAYANFGYFGFIPILILGFIIAKLYAYEMKTKRKDILFYCWIFIVYFQLMGVIRGYIRNIVFLSAWTFLIFYVFKVRKISIYEMRQS